MTLFSFSAATMLFASADFNGDKVLSDSDYTRLEKCLAYQSYLDLNKPVDVIEEKLKITPTDCKTINDLDGDGLIDSSDLNRLEQCLAHISYQEIRSDLTIEQLDGKLNMNFKEECSAVLIPKTLIWDKTNWDEGLWE